MSQIYLNLVLPACKKEKTISKDIKSKDEALRILSKKYDKLIF